MEDRIGDRVKILDLVGRLHRCVERRDWKSAKFIFESQNDVANLSDSLGSLKIPQRFVGADSQVSFPSEREARVTSVVLKIGGTNLPKILACGLEKLKLTKKKNEWKISECVYEMDTEMFADWGSGIF